MSNDIVIKLPSSFLGAIDGAQTIPEKIAVIQGYLKKLEDAKKERAEWRKQLEERANRLQEQRDALRDRRKQIEDEKREIEDQKRAIAERRKATMTDDQKKALDDEEKAVEEREKINQEREKETEDQENETEDQVKEVEIQKKHAEDVDPAQDAEIILLSTTLQNLVDSSAPLPPPATASPTVPSGFSPLLLHRIQRQRLRRVAHPLRSALDHRQRLRRTRIFWTDQLTQAFDEAIQSLGGLYSATVTAEQVKKLMEDLDVTESQIANRIQNLRRKKHPRDDDGGENGSDTCVYGEWVVKGSLREFVVNNRKGGRMFLVSEYTW
ncbi:hypothetical protein DY000_02049954 [Brassica cretica]|uniref:Uncharacterized protein n=1 Tax=Brassica cretica TaxID=69181 RepID=A0ABQ7EXC7_BRACR|nr:hypothetical protein DY000_02049954 [Brassica cretica]